MAITPKKLPRLNITVPIVSPTRTPTPAFQQFWQQAMDRIETRLGALELQALQDAVDTVNAAVVSVQAIADGAQGAADSIATASALQNSYVTGATISALAVGPEIDISAHTRHYGDGTTASVNSGSISTGLAYDTRYDIYYDDAARTGGAVTYDATATAGDAVYSVANPNRHYVGAVLTPQTSGDPDTTGVQTPPPNVIAIEIVPSITPL